VTYRESDPSTATERAAAVRLERLAEEGHAAAAARRQGEARERARLDEAAAPLRALRAERSLSWLGTFVGMTGWPRAEWWFATTMLAGALALPLSFWLLHAGRHDELVFIVPGAALAGCVAFAIFATVARLLLPLRARRALGTLSALPFPLARYRDALGQEAIAKLVVQVELAGLRPTVELVRGLCARMEATSGVEVHEDEGALCLSLTPAPRGPFLFGHANYGVHRFVLLLVEHVLLSLHPVYPIAAVHLDPSTYEEEALRDVGEPGSS
jgi:hypothetical protein